MDLLKLIIDPKKMNNTCLLCFKCSDLLTNLYDKNEILDEQFQYNISLWNIMKELFPTYEFLLNQACGDCTTLIFKMFLLLRRSQRNNYLLYYLIGDITNCLDRDIDTRKKLKIKINIPTFDTLLCKENVKETLCKCKKCDMIFKSKYMLQQHNKITHNNSNDAIICDTCGKEFLKSSSLKSHLCSHIDKLCPYCFKVLKSHSHFNLHVKNHEHPTQRKRYKKHYNCDDCNYKTLNKMSLEAHMNKVHLNIRPYVCEICDKGFFKKSNLIEHCKTHNKLKDKMCDVCGDSFVNDKTLKEHLRLHSGNKPYKCKLCCSSFINSGRRYEHMARKHEERNESCETCGKLFSLKKDLNSHLRTVHGGNNDSYFFEVNNVQINLELEK